MAYHELKGASAMKQRQTYNKKLEAESGPAILDAVPSDVRGPGRDSYTSKRFEKPTDKPDYARLSSAGSTGSELSLPGATADEIILQDSLSVRAGIARPGPHRGHAWPLTSQESSWDDPDATPRGVRSHRQKMTSLEPFLQGNGLREDDGDSFRSTVVSPVLIVRSAFFQFRQYSGSMSWHILQSCHWDTRHPMLIRYNASACRGLD